MHAVHRMRSGRPDCSFDDDPRRSQPRRTGCRAPCLNGAWVPISSKYRCKRGSRAASSTWPMRLMTCGRTGKRSAIVLLPAALLAALCLLPDALNVQHGLVAAFHARARDSQCDLPAPVGVWRRNPTIPRPNCHRHPCFPRPRSWSRIVALWILTLIVNLLVLCTIRRAQERRACRRSAHTARRRSSAWRSGSRPPTHGSPCCITPFR